MSPPSLATLQTQCERYYRKDLAEHGPGGFFVQGVALCDRLATTQTVPDFLQVAAALLSVLLASASALELDNLKALRIYHNARPGDWRGQVACAQEHLRAEASPLTLAEHRASSLI